MSEQRIGVLGPGAVGGLLAARLAHRGHDVTVIGTEQTAAVIAARGLRLHATGADVLTVWPRACAWLTDPVDILFVTVKATDLLQALQRAPARPLTRIPVIPLLNGTDHVRLIRWLYPAATVVAATISVEATRRTPGVIEQSSAVAEVELTEDPAEPATAGQIADLLEAAGFLVRTLTCENQVLWRKLAMLAPYALLTASARAPIGEALSLRPDLLPSLAAEAAAAGKACGAEVSARSAEARVLRLPPHAQSSMLKDLLSGRPLELDAIAGPVIRALSARHAPATVSAVAEILDHAGSRR
jgi:2-dehydropantoate 2-reductase